MNDKTLADRSAILKIRRLAYELMNGPASVSRDHRRRLAASIIATANSLFGGEVRRECPFCGKDSWKYSEWCLDCYQKQKGAFRMTDDWANEHLHQECIEKNKNSDFLCAECNRAFALGVLRGEIERLYDS